MQKRIILTVLALASGCAGTVAQSNPPPAFPQQPGEVVTTKSDDGSLSTRVIARYNQNTALGQVLDAEEQLKAVQDMFPTVKIYDEGRARNHAILVSSTQTNSETLAALDEDLRVMSHILDKTVSEGAAKNQEQMLGIYVTAQPGGRSPQSLYFEGQGVVFIRSVKMPLLPGGHRQTEKDAPQKDSAWEQAKQEVDGPKVRWNKLDLAARREAVPYDADKVEALKRDVVGALKNAAHIRGLGENESVTVVLLGAAEGGGGALYSNSMTGAGMVGMEAPPRDGAGRPATMTIRVKKSDAMAAQSGAIDSAELQKRSVISVY
jgi:hypothetical protein